jgi:hypothetical protein
MSRSPYPGQNAGRYERLKAHIRDMVEPKSRGAAFEFAHLAQYIAAQGHKPVPRSPISHNFTDQRGVRELSCYTIIDHIV